jgi:hypothetical protein
VKIFIIILLSIILSKNSPCPVAGEEGELNREWRKEFLQNNVRQNNGTGFGAGRNGFAQR